MRSMSAQAVLAMSQRMSQPMRADRGPAGARVPPARAATLATMGSAQAAVALAAAAQAAMALAAAALAVAAARRH